MLERRLNRVILYINSYIMLRKAGTNKDASVPFSNISYRLTRFTTLSEQSNGRVYFMV